MSTLSLETTSTSAGSGIESLGAYLFGPENAVLGRSIGLGQDGDGRTTVKLGSAPLTISGPSGLGKSLLLQALAAAWDRQHGKDTVLFTTGTDFARNYAKAASLSEVPRFQQRYQRAGCLLIDDLDSLHSKPGAQWQMGTIVEHRQRHERPTVITSRRPLRRLNLSPRLQSRLAGGLTLPIHVPTAETRSAILSQLCDSLGLQLEPEASQLLLQMNSLTIPQLSGLLNQLRQSGRPEGTSPSTLDGERIAVRTKQVAEWCQTVTGPICDAKDVIRATARHFGLSQRNLTGSSRRKSDVMARSVAMYLIRELTGCSYAQVGRHFGGRDHTTVMHAHKKIGTQQSTDSDTRQVLNEIRRRLDDQRSPAASAQESRPRQRRRTRRGRL